MPAAHALHCLRRGVLRARSAGGLALVVLLLVGCANLHDTRAAAATLAVRSEPSQRSKDATLLTSNGSLPPEVSSVYVRLPQTVPAGQPLRVLVALHGIGGDGAAFASDLTAAADRNSWLLVAPTIRYGDWMDPQQVAHEDVLLVNWLYAYLSQLPAQTSLPIEPSVLLLGFSRGAQLAHRFAEAYPKHALAVAAAAAGSYTLPAAITADGTRLPFPFGVADFQASVGQVFAPSELQSVHFWIAVGGSDTNPADVPRQFDACQGDDRLDRANAFVAALGTINVSAELAVFPDVPHAFTPAMLDSAVAFLASQSATVYSGAV